MKRFTRSQAWKYPLEQPKQQQGHETWYLQYQESLWGRAIQNSCKKITST